MQAASVAETGNYTIIDNRGVTVAIYDVVGERSIALDIEDLRSHASAYETKFSEYVAKVGKLGEPFISPISLSYDKLGETNIIRMFIDAMFNLPSGLSRRVPVDKRVSIVVINNLIRFQFDPANIVTLAYQVASGRFEAHSISQGEPVLDQYNKVVEQELYKDAQLVLIIKYLISQVPNSSIQILNLFK